MPDANAADEPRAGSLVLALFANPLHALILRAHLDGPLRPAQTQEKIGWAAQTSLRAATTELRQIGALGKLEIRQPRFAVENELTPAGRELLVVADVVEAWLAHAPGGPVALESDAARGAVKALMGGWSSTLIRALADRPRTLTELDHLIPEISYPSLERRLAKLRAAGQIEPIEAERRGTPYVVTDWLRRSIAPLCAAARFERRHLRTSAAPIARLELEAAFMLAIPLTSLPESASGTCTLAAQIEAAEATPSARDLAGVTTKVERGKIVACAAQIVPCPPTWALGAPEAWLDAFVEGRLEKLRIGGTKPQLALSLVSGAHLALFGKQSKALRAAARS